MFDQREFYSVPQLQEAILRGDRRGLAQAITLIESEGLKNQQLAADLMVSLEKVAQALPKSILRFGVTGVPGVGKSTFIERFGLHCIENLQKKVAVLAIDPSSPVRGGSILADKTRMLDLARHKDAYIRPSPANGHLGGATRCTEQAAFLCEMAGFDIVIIETVGVGQSEVEVAAMVDCLIALILPGGGDDIQGMKRGLMEVIDLLIIHKSDGVLASEARVTQQQYQAAMEWLRGKGVCRVLTASSIEPHGNSQLYSEIIEKALKLREHRHKHPTLAADFKKEIVYLFDQMYEHHPRWCALRSELLQGIKQGTHTKTEAAQKYIQTFFSAN